MMWELGGKGLCKYWYQSSGLWQATLTTSPPTLHDALPISQNCYWMWENLERVKSCGLKQLARRKRFESEHVKPGRRGTSSCTDGMNSASPGVPGTQTCTSQRTGSDCGTQKWGSNSTGIAALWLLAGAPLHALSAVACLHVGAEWMKSWLSHSSEAGTDPRKEGGWERRSGLAKNMSRNPQGPAGEQC